MTGITDGVDGATNVLLRMPSMGGGRELCTSLLTEAAESPSVLFVTYTRRASDCVAQIDRTAAHTLGVVTVGDATVDTTDDAVRTDNVGTPSDLTGLGIAIGRYLSEWEPPVLVCFESLTSLLQYVDLETAYEFLHAITGQVYAADARAHFHIDPSAHDRKTVAAITSLFDASVTPDDDQPVRTRDTIP